uniref:Very-long-chain 3-oxoacyl-CoA reductase n=1 Tax=Percolomonas cosmopolitus TaxID=63605 RepID=A0A7S1PH88_9EUKA
MLSTLLTITGTIFSLYYTGKLLLFLYTTFLYNGAALVKKNVLNKQKWVTVTGCTSGIGKGFAVEAAKKYGANVVLVARSQQKLDEFANELQSKYKVQTKTVVIDFAEKDIDYSPLKNAVKGLDVGCLVNNVGINTEVPDRYLDCSEHEINNMVHVNVDSLLNVSRIVLPQIVKEDGKGRGLLINLSSFSATNPVPHMAVYSATKAFINSFSLAMRSEYRNLEVLSLNPMLVASAMTHIKDNRAGFTVCTGQRLAADTFKAYGAPLLAGTFSPYWPHTLQMFAMSLLPVKVQDNITRQRMIVVKKKLLKRKARNAQ